MSTSQPAPVRLIEEALLAADLAYSLVLACQEAAVEGREADALRGLKIVASACAHAQPVLRGVIKAERQTAQARDLTQRTLARFFPGKPEEQPHASNDKQPVTSEQPGPSVA